MANDNLYRCPFCDGTTHNSIKLRSVEALVRVHKEAQFPLTIIDPATGFNVAELPICIKTVFFFKTNNIPKSGKRIKLYCEDV